MKIAQLTALSLLIPCVAFAGDAVTHWKADPQKSSVTWTVMYGGKPVTGSLPSFSPDIAFDPAHLDKSKVSVTFDMAKVHSSDSNAQQNLPAGDWFAVAQYPSAVFKSNSFRHISGDNYEASGSLTVRDKTENITLPFSVKISAGKTAVMDGTTTIKRLDFGVGQGDWAKTDSVAGDVKVTIHVEAVAY